MIQNSLQQTVTQKLNIVVNNTNKALEKVLQDSSKSEVEVLSSGKDLKSVINSLFKKTEQNDTANKQLLELVKNNPTLKNLKNVSKTINDLKKVLDKTDVETNKILKNISTTLKNINPTKLEQTFKFSGVFLESNLKESVDIKENISKLLTKIDKNLEPKEQKILSDVKDVINKDFSKTDLKSLLTKLEKLPLTKSSLSILNQLKNPTITNKLTDTLVKQSLTKIVDIVEKQLEPKTQTPQKQILNELKENVQKDFSKPKFEQILSKFEKTPLSKENLHVVEQLKKLNTPDEVVTKDLKAVVLKTTQDVTNSNIPNKTEILKHLDKLALQIDNQQLISYLSNSSCLYLPFNWDGLEEGEIEMKTLKDEKFYCDINLKLKKFGEINLKLMLYEKNKLNLHFYSKNQEFKDVVKENISSLRVALIDAHIVPSEIRIFEKKVSPYQETQNNELKMGFEVKI